MSLRLSLPVWGKRAVARLVRVVAAHLVGVFEDEVLALVQLAADVDDAAQDAPRVLHAQVNLTCKLIGLELLRAQNHMTRRVLHVVAGHVTAAHTERKKEILGLRFGFKIWV